MQNDKTAPKYVGYDENKLQEMKTTGRKWISKSWRKTDSFTTTEVRIWNLK
jgi:hypothetical protein